MTRKFFKILSLIVLSSLLMFRCEEEGTVEHVKIISAIDWSPSNNNSLMTLKDEFDQVWEKNSGCSNAFATSPRVPQLELFLVDTNKTILKQVTNNLRQSYSTNISFAPSSDKVILWGNSQSVYVVDTSGNHRILFYQKQIIDFDWSSDGQSIIGITPSDSSFNWIIFRREVNGTGYSTLIDTSLVGDIACSNQNKIAFIITKQNSLSLNMMNLSDTNVSTIDTGLQYSNLTWTPDGQKILFSNFVSTQKSELYVLNVTTLAKQKIVDSVKVKYLSSLKYSPDGTMISYSGEGRIYIIDANGNNLLSVTSQSNGSWSPDSRKIAYVYKNEIFIQTVK